MCAFSRPVLAHCATNSRCDRRAIVRVTHSDNGTVSNVITASSGEIVSIITSTATTVKTEVSSWLIVIDSDVWTLSMSLVTRLSTSPRCRESKYDSGSRCTLSSTSARSATIVRCTVTLSNRDWAQTISAASRYSTSASSSVRPTAAKSTPTPGVTFIRDNRSANIPSPRARAAATACSLVMPVGSCRPITPLNNRSVAWPRIRGPTTPTAIPPMPSAITAEVKPRCGVSRFNSRIAVRRKSRDRSGGGGVPSRIAIRIGALIGPPPRPANQRTPRTRGTRRAEIRGCRSRPLGRRRRRRSDRLRRQSKSVATQ